jgi:hypothetical protein
MIRFWLPEIFWDVLLDNLIVWENGDYCLREKRMKINRHGGEMSGL